MAKPKTNDGAEISVHPAADLFPMLSDTELADLAKDIKEHGLVHPVVMFKGVLLDGRNRLAACKIAEVEPTFTEYDGDDPTMFIWSTNFHRRHLKSSQAAMALAERKKIDPDFVLAVIEPLKQEAAEAKAAGQKSGGKTSGRGRKKVDSLVGKIPPSKTRDKVANSHGTNAKSVATCERILVEHPELVADIKSGKKSITQATREIKKTEIAKTVDWPDGKYRVIYADPPWSYGNTQPDYHTEQSDHYPTMELKDICALPVKELAMDDAVLFIWVTSPTLEESFQVIKAWGFKYKASFVWDKIKHNMGHYNSVRHEFLLIAVRGSCQPDVARLFDSVYSSEREGHSKKPHFFYEVIDTTYPHGPRIEMFARNTREGWASYGQQA